MIGPTRTDHRRLAPVSQWRGRRRRTRLLRLLTRCEKGDVPHRRGRRGVRPCRAVWLGCRPSLAPRAFKWVVSQQHENGGFPHSLGDYRVLSDRRSYPRNLSMILYHLTIGFTGDAALPHASSSGGAAQGEC